MPHYFTPLPVKDLLKKQKSVRKSVESGQIYTVYSRSVPIFHILPLNIEITDLESVETGKYTPLKKPHDRKNEIPSLKVNILPKKIDRNFIYT